MLNSQPAKGQAQLTQWPDSSAGQSKESTALLLAHYLARPKSQVTPLSSSQLLLGGAATLPVKDRRN